jgi:multidrug efflux pump subunit AcrB
MTLLLVPPGKRAATAQEFAERARQRLSGIAGLTIAVEDPSRQGFGAEQGAPIDLTIRGPDWKTLVEEATELKNRLAASGQIVDLTTDYQVGLPEVRVLPDRRRASDLGISISDLATTVNALVGGSIIGKFETGGRRVDIRARLLSSQRTRAEDIGSLRIRTAEGNLVPLAMLISSSEEPALQAIRRVDRERAIRLTGNVPQGKSQADAIALVQQLAGDLPEGYRLVLGGQANQLSETASGVAFALVVGILVAYMVLASQFNSFLHPVTVLTILPLALGGAAFGLKAASASLNLFSMIGLLLLMGLVKKNSILLVEYANQLRETEGLETPEALRRAGPLRLRPILMTTVATMMAAVPAVLGLGPGAETRGPMGAAVLGGLALSTLLCLLVVPAFYLLSDRLRPRRTPPVAPTPPGEPSEGLGV